MIFPDFLGVEKYENGSVKQTIRDEVKKKDLALRHLTLE